MSIKVILGLPYLSKGPLLAKAAAMRAPVLVSANAFSSWSDAGPAPKAFEYSRPQWLEHVRRGNSGPITLGRKQRTRTWSGWNLNSLPNADVLNEVWLDGAGFTMMFLENGYPWSPEQYIFGLCAKYPWTRFASLDLCVEEEVSADHFEVQERISKTINLNKTCQMLANDAGIGDRLMPVIQGATPDDYLRCFDALEPMIGEERLIGVGSMCRRKTAGVEGIVSIVEALDRRLPNGIKLHLFGVKSDGAEAVSDIGGRIYSIDSQAYGVRARKIAIEQRKVDPAFSKTNAFVAEIMEKWYRGQCERMASAKARPIQNSLPLTFTSFREKSKIETLEEQARQLIADLIEEGELDADQVISHHLIQTIMADIADDPAAN